MRKSKRGAGGSEDSAHVGAIWCSGALVLWCFGALVLWCFGALVLWCFGAHRLGIGAIGPVD